MGTGLPGAIGAAFANPDEQIVCLTGDGGLMICAQELHTAAEHDLDLVVLVSVNDDYGIISKSMRSEYGPEARFRWDSPNFTKVAEGFDCRASRVETAAELQAATEDALKRSGPDVISVAVDPNEPAAPDAGDYESTVDLV